MKFIQVKYPAKQYVKAVSLTGSSNNFFFVIPCQKKKEVNVMFCGDNHIIQDGDM